MRGACGLSFAATADEAFFGLGERFNALDQRGNVLDMRCYEQYKNQGKRTYMPDSVFALVGGLWRLRGEHPLDAVRSGAAGRIAGRWKPISAPMKRSSCAGSRATIRWTIIGQFAQ